MIFKFQIDDIDSKEADDIAVQIMEFLRDELSILVSDYWIGDSDE